MAGIRILIRSGVLKSAEDPSMMEDILGHWLKTFEAMEAAMTQLREAIMPTMVFDGREWSAASVDQPKAVRTRKLKDESLSFMRDVRRMLWQCNPFLHDIAAAFILQHSEVHRGEQRQKEDDARYPRLNGCRDTRGWMSK